MINNNVETPEFVIFNKDETVTESVFKDTVTLGLIAAGVVFSNGDIVWSSITGTMFVMFGVAKMFSLVKQRTLAFSNKEDLINWAKGQ